MRGVGLIKSLIQNLGLKSFFSPSQMNCQEVFFTLLCFYLLTQRECTTILPYFARSQKEDPSGKITSEAGRGGEGLQSQHSGGRGRQISEFKASLIYKVSSRTARAIKRNPVLKKQNKTKTNTNKDNIGEGARQTSDIL